MRSYLAISFFKQCLNPANPYVFGNFYIKKIFIIDIFFGSIINKKERQIKNSKRHTPKPRFKRSFIIPMNSSWLNSPSPKQKNSIKQISMREIRRFYP